MSPNRSKPTTWPYCCTCSAASACEYACVARPPAPTAATAAAPSMPAPPSAYGVLGLEEKRTLRRAASTASSMLPRRPCAGESGHRWLRGVPSGVCGLLPPTPSPRRCLRKLFTLPMLRRRAKSRGEAAACAGCGGLLAAAASESPIALLVASFPLACFECLRFLLFRWRSTRFLCISSRKARRVSTRRSRAERDSSCCTCL